MTKFHRSKIPRSQLLQLAQPELSRADVACSSALEIVWGNSCFKTHGGKENFENGNWDFQPCYDELMEINLSVI